MDIHLNAWGVKSRIDGTENVAIQVREVDSKDKVIVHMSQATARIMVEDLAKILPPKDPK
jgi:hypothetical protein